MLLWVGNTEEKPSWIIPLSSWSETRLQVQRIWSRQLPEIQCVRNTCMDDWIVGFSKQSILFKQVKYFSFLIYIDLTIGTQRDQKLGNFTIFDLDVCDGTSLLFFIVFYLVKDCAFW